jgi:uncharacterized membrane protein
MEHIMRNFVAIAVVLIGLAAVALADMPQYAIIDLGVVNAGDYGAQGLGISPGGVCSGRSLGSPTTGFTWTAAGGLVALETFAERSYYAANGANDSGLVAGTATTTPYGSSPLPVLWTNGVVSQLALPSGQSYGHGEDVNDARLAVGSIGSGVGQRGILWDDGSPAIITTTTGDGEYMVSAFGVNNAGMIAGYGWDPDNAARNVGLLYDVANDVMMEVPPLADDNGTIAFGISESGSVVGSSSYNQADSLPFIWDAVNGTREIPLPTGASQGKATGANTAGWVVGTASGVYALPYLYDGTQTYRLQDLIDPASGWDLSTNTSSSAQGISEDGTIVGTGILDGAPRAYAMVLIPEPGSLGLLLVAGLSLLRGRR